MATEASARIRSLRITGGNGCNHRLKTPLRGAGPGRGRPVL